MYNDITYDMYNDISYYMYDDISYYMYDDINHDMYDDISYDIYDDIRCSAILVIICRLARRCSPSACPESRQKYHTSSRACIRALMCAGMCTRSSIFRKPSHGM